MSTQQVDGVFRLKGLPTSLGQYIHLIYPSRSALHADGEDGTYALAKAAIVRTMRNRLDDKSFEWKDGEYFLQFLDTHAVDGDEDAEVEVDVDREDDDSNAFTSTRSPVIIQGIKNALDAFRRELRGERDSADTASHEAVLWDLTRAKGALAELASRQSSSRALKEIHAIDLALTTFSRELYGENKDKGFVDMAWRELFAAMEALAKLAGKHTSSTKQGSAARELRINASYIRMGELMAEIEAQIDRGSVSPSISFGLYKELDEELHTVRELVANGATESEREALDEGTQEVEELKRRLERHAARFAEGAVSVSTASQSDEFNRPTTSQDASNERAEIDHLADLGQKMKNYIESDEFDASIAQATFREMIQLAYRLRKTFVRTQKQGDVDVLDSFMNDAQRQLEDKVASAQLSQSAPVFSNVPRSVAELERTMPLPTARGKAVALKAVFYSGPAFKGQHVSEEHVVMGQREFKDKTDHAKGPFFTRNFCRIVKPFHEIEKTKQFVSIRLYFRAAHDAAAEWKVLSEDKNINSSQRMPLPLAVRQKK